MILFVVSNFYRMVLLILWYMLYYTLNLFTISLNCSGENAKKRYQFAYSYHGFKFPSYLCS